MEDSSLQPHQQRIVDEFNQLGERTRKLAQFIDGSDLFKGLPLDERTDLWCQYLHMHEYLETLKRRIRRWDADALRAAHEQGVVA